MTKRVLILGGTGMLGSMCVRVLKDEYEVTATAQDFELFHQARVDFPGVNWFYLGAFDVLTHFDLSQFDAIINCIGVIKPCIGDSPLEAIRINAMFPHQLQQAAQDTHIIQIATDCVFSGTQGLGAAYDENSLYDATDVYGKTKSLGEAIAPNVSLIRCSIIGPEPYHKRSLLEWFRNQPDGATVQGYANHKWNGVTTLAFAKICQTIIDNDLRLPSPLHMVSRPTTKYDLLCFFANYFRPDITVDMTFADTEVNRLLVTKHTEVMLDVWQQAGYDWPDVDDLVAELAEYLKTAER